VATAAGVRDAVHGETRAERLPSGLRVVVQRDRLLPAVRVHLRYAVGSRHEAPHQHGLAHLLEHLMFAGSPSFPAGEHARRIQEGGGRDVNATTDQDRTAFFQTVPAALLPLTLELEADRMGGLADVLTADAVRAQLRVVEREDQERYRQPYGDATARLLRRCFPPGHPYRHAAMGDLARLARLSVADVAAFHRAHYRPENAVLSVVGDVDPARTIRLAGTAFAAVRTGGAGAPPGAAAPPGGAASGASGPERVPAPPGASDRVHVAVRTPPFGTEAHETVTVLAALLGAGRGSVLFRALVRERRVARPARELMSAWTLRAGASLLFGAASAAPGVSGDRLAEALREVLADAWRTVTEAALRRAVAMAVSEELTRLDDPAARAAALASHTALDGDPLGAYTRVERLRAVTADQVAGAARRLLDPRRTVLLVHSRDRRSGTAR
jgi:zinc protease